MICRSKQAYKEKFEERKLMVLKSGLFLPGGKYTQESMYWILIDNGTPYGPEGFSKAPYLCKKSTAGADRVAATQNW